MLRALSALNPQTLYSLCAIFRVFREKGVFHQREHTRRIQVTPEAAMLRMARASSAK
jgi:hypothetical protein